MRTPWRFVADLVSRKPKAYASAERPISTDETKAIEYYPTNGDRVDAVEQTAEGTAPDTMDRATDAPMSGALPKVEDDAKLVSKSRRRNKATQDAGSAAVDIAAPSKPLPQTVAPTTLLEDMAAIDAEVEMLRHQLVAKLTEQNAQLRKMLSRFEAS